MTSCHHILSEEGKKNEKNESRSCAKIGGGAVYHFVLRCDVYSQSGMN